ncbi:hypothetical protein RJ639_033016 [Escallonia herrerae]|uniref:J domain-containing protein n=1 Tax=Escallonia herrerae TaxID=1293975 RepID=A0AA89BA87_9ASTE|nr:hypothetical protein RJ639_033016 [Escallonia herrerae]
MECNRDEAARAKEVAEKKFLSKDYAGAKRFASKSQNLYPGLEGISHMLATLDVYTSAENKINGEADYYGILGVSPRADDETVRKQYRKLALMLHPDKNKSVGADGAFRLLSEAWSLLSDKTKRQAYDQKRNVKVFQPKAPPQSGGSTSPQSNGFYNFSKSTTSHTKPPKSSATPKTNTTTKSYEAPGSYTTPKANSTPKNNTTPKSSTTPISKATHKSNTAPMSNTALKSNTIPKSKTSKAPASSVPAASQKPKQDTFWTVCHRCKMQYEYEIFYLNHNLLCPNCHEAFFAAETSPPSFSGSKVPSHQSHSQHRQNSKHHEASKNILGRSNSSNSNGGSGVFNVPDTSSNSNVQWGPFSKATGAASAAQAASMVHQAYEKVKREREEAQAATKREEALRRKYHVSKRTAGISSSGHSNSAKRRRGIDDLSANRDNMDQMGMVTGLKQSCLEHEKVVGSSKSSGKKVASTIEIQSLLMEKARMEIHKKLHEWGSATVARSEVDGEEDVSRKARGGKGADSALVNGARLNVDSSEQVDAWNRVPTSKSDRTNSADDSTKGSMTPMSIDVPDPDFHDFDRDRTERCFGENQVWAAYDDEDGMPRYYAMIHNMISLNPFEVRISWLNSKTNSELGPMNWIGSGFAKTCGDFRIGKHEINNSVNSFSHKVRWTKGTHGVVSIYPKKGDVWALYRNWSPDWNELTADEVIHKYDMVEVVEDYEEELGVTVTPLVKVAGFKTLFHCHLDAKAVKRIPREEMFRFSHHVPSYLLTGQEAPHAPKGCRELDPAATPLELLHVIIDVKEAEMMENEENIADRNGKANNEEREEI